MWSGNRSAATLLCQHRSLSGLNLAQSVAAGAKPSEKISSSTAKGHSLVGPYSVGMSSPAPEPTDEVLARRAAGGDRAAFEELTNRYRVRVIGLLRKSGARDPDDLAQEVFLKALGAIPRWEDGNFKAWLFRIARNAAISAARGKKEKQADELVLLTVAAPAAADDWATELVPKLRKCLGLLQTKHPPFSEAVVMQMAGAELAEIAEGLGIPIDTVKTRIFRGKQALRKCVGDEP